MRYLLTLAILAFLAVPAYAAYTGPNSGPQGAYKGPISGSQADTVAQALNLPDDSRVTLTGKIVSKMAGSKDEYMFQDNTGEILIEVSDKVMARTGVEIGPDTLVRISGKMDKDFAKKPEIEVKNLEVVK